MKKLWRKYLALATVTALTTFSLAGCGVKSTDVPEEASTESSDAETATTEAVTDDGQIEKATEGSITVYTAFEDDQIDKYLTSFKEKYPDINVDVIRESTGTLIAKVIAEKDNPVADVIWGTSASVMLQLEPYGLIKGYKPENADLLDPKFYDSSSEEPLWTGCDVYETAFLVNTQVCEDAGVPVPTSFADLLDPCYKGMIVMPDPTSSGTGMLSVNGILQIMGEEAGWEYMKELNENIACYTTSGSKPAKMAAAGECGIGISFGYRCSTLLAEGNPVEVVFPSEGCGWDVEANCLLAKDEINPAAYTFLDWAISDEAMADYATEYPITGRGVIGEIPNGYSETPLENLCDLDLAQAALDRDSIIEKFTPFLSGKESE
ncbi:MAG: extracellular solute-binding protein [Lachnospiraceae bacterium]